MASDVIIREAACGDAAAIARVHVASWRTTYRGLMPDAVLDGLSVERRRAMWEDRLCGGAARSGCDIVAEAAGGEIVGFASGGPPQEGQEVPGHDAELYTIYLLREAQGGGTGRRLMRTAAEALLAAGFRRMALWVLFENQPSRRFYERLGGTLLATKPFEIGGATLEEVAYGYDLTALTELLRQGHR